MAVKRNLEKQKEKVKKTLSHTTPVKTKGSKPFPIVALGTSAGGLDPLSVFLENVPADLGVAYVVIQHLSPTHESILPDLLQRKTKMPVHTVINGMEVKKDTVFVIPPNAMMSIVDGKLTLGPRVKTDGFVHTVDYFFSALSQIYQHKAIAIVLSGTGSDGAVGIKAVKADGGITMAQDKTARFDGMPKNAIETGFVDFVLPPADMAKELTSLLKNNFLPVSSPESVNLDTAQLRKIFLLLLNKKGVDFSNYKHTTINRRISRRMSLLKIKALNLYIDYIKEHPREIDLLYNDLLINVTSFFREPGMFQTLSKKIFPALLKRRRQNDAIRIWIAACATGEEAYSTAICLFEYLKDKALNTPIQVFATDLNETSIEKARAGIYTEGSLQNISAQRLARYFVKVSGGYQIIKPIRDVCIFATHNLLKDPPFSKMDLISCQNVMIYLEASPQRKILQTFHYALKPTGYLLLGRSETIGNSTDHFDQSDKDLKVYVKKSVELGITLDFSLRKPVSEAVLPGEGSKTLVSESVEFDVEKEANRVLLSRYVPASVVVNKDLQILRFHGPTANYFQPAAGKASLHLLKMIRDELVFELRGVLHKLKKDNRATKKEGILLNVNGSDIEITIEAVPLKVSQKDSYVLILFKEDKVVSGENKVAKNIVRTIRTDSKEKRIVMLEQEIKEAREHMKTMSEEFEATREELQSANEEVLSSNEELQSINEELETSKEELQSTNEELTTINEELQQRNTDLKEAVDYAEAIIQTIREPLLVLSGDCRVRMVNMAFYNTFKFNSDEVEGFYFYEIGDGRFNNIALKKQLAEIISKNRNFNNFEVIAEFKELGQKNLLFSAMRIQQRDTKKDRILLAIQDITELRNNEEQLKVREESFRLLVQNSFDIITIFSADGTIKFQSESVEHILGYKPEEQIGKNIFQDSLVHPDDRHLKLKMFRDCIEHPGEDVRTEFRLQHKSGNFKIFEAVCISLLDNAKVKGVVANYRDITDKKALEKQKDDFIGVASHELKTPVTSIKAYSQILGEVFAGSDDRKSAEMVAKMNKQVDRLTSLVKDLLDVTRISEGKIALREELYDVNELIETMTDELQRTTKKHRIVKKLSKIPFVWGDKERTGQVITNLLSNAVKYSPDSEEIIISSRVSKNIFTICVRDSGIGISKGTQAKIFERFFRVNDKTVSTYPGLGLGLYISNEIIKRQGGRITLKSTLKKGSTFCIELPCKKKPGAGMF